MFFKIIQFLVKFEFLYFFLKNGETYSQKNIPKKTSKSPCSQESAQKIRRRQKAPPFTISNGRRRNHPELYDFEEIIAVNDPVNPDDILTYKVRSKDGTEWDADTIVWFFTLNAICNIIPK